MKVHLRQIPAEGLHLEGEEECPIADLDSEELACAGSLSYALDIGITAGALWANGTLKQPMKLQCVACLEPFIHTIEVRSFALHTETAGPEVVDLTPFIREDILLNLPVHPHCDREGGLICPAHNVKETSDSPPPVAGPAPEWSVLDKLKL
jgi:uncharacterized metal-binding protein YceD (DUF177 family)